MAHSQVGKGYSGAEKAEVLVNLVALRQQLEAALTALVALGRGSAEGPERLETALQAIHDMICPAAALKPLEFRRASIQVKGLGTQIELRTRSGEGSDEDD